MRETPKIPVDRLKVRGTLSFFKSEKCAKIVLASETSVTNYTLGNTVNPVNKGQARGKPKTCFSPQVTFTQNVFFLLNHCRLDDLHNA